ncbi:MAG TPA: PIN domain-containing protein [Vicinamibacterales bacterium]|nr:PIN domain-containing protein [Vicinamibacterales bacterium]
MKAECVLDAGVLAYAVSSAPSEAARKRKAIELIKRADFGLSTAILEEFYVTVTTRFRKPLAPATAMALLDEYRIFPVVGTDYPMIASAVELSLLHGLSYRDASALAAARAIEARILYSSAFGAGRVFDGIQVLDPFAGI